MYCDETAFRLTPYIPYAWQEKGKQIRIFPRKGKTLKVLGFMALDNRLKFYTTEESINGEFVVDCLNQLSYEIEELTVIIMDNAPTHRCHLLYDQISQWEKRGLYIFYLPKYSPHLNKIEILWRKMKYSWLSPGNYYSWTTLTKAVRQILAQLGTKYQIKFTNSIVGV